MSNQPERAAYRVAEAAAALGVSKRHIYSLMNRDQLGFVQAGDVRLIPRAALDRLLAVDSTMEPRNAQHPKK